MEIRLDKWEKGEMKRIYFNALALGSAKVYACANKSGNFDVGSFTDVPGKSGLINTAMDEGVKLIEKLIGKPISYDTKFADVWSAIGD